MMDLTESQKYRLACSMGGNCENIRSRLRHIINASPDQYVVNYCFVHGNLTRQQATIIADMVEKMAQGVNMTSITVKLKNGKIREFPYQGRCGGSWSNTIQYKGAFAIITDEWGNQTIFPATDIEEVTVDRGR
jgi:hypothetical protein